MNLKGRYVNSDVGYGKVIDLKDPLKLGRVLISFEFRGENRKEWCYPHYK